MYTLKILLPYAGDEGFLPNIRINNVNDVETFYNNFDVFYHHV